MEAVRRKTVEVGGREFVVRPLLGVVARDFYGIERPDEHTRLAAMVAKVLERTAPEVTEDWVLKNGDMAEYRDVMEALNEVTNGKKTAPAGEATGP